MGRDLQWYILPKSLLVHDTSRAICLDLDCEPDNKKKIVLLKDFLHISTSDATKYKIHDHADDWCPLCKMYMAGIYTSSLVLAKHHIWHSYGDLIWNSDWNIRCLDMGSRSTPFVQKFKKSHRYREITGQDMTYASTVLEMTGTPSLDYDQEACEESRAVLKFLKTWNKDVIMIMQDEP